MLRVLWRIIKYFIILVVVLFLMIIFNKEIKTTYNSIYYAIKGVNMSKSQWKSFDFRTIKGEPYSKDYYVLSNYEFTTIYPYDGALGCIGGSDYNKQLSIYEKSDNLSEVYWPKYHETAYLFCTNDEETFSKHELGKGHILEVKKYENSYFVTVNDCFYNVRTYISKDAGASWNLFSQDSILHFFSEDKFIYVESRENSPYPAKIDGKNMIFYDYGGKYNYYYTKDGRKSFVALPEKILEYARQTQDREHGLNTLRFDTYNGRLIFLLKDSIVLIDIDTLEEERIQLNLPKGYKIASQESREYGKNLYEDSSTDNKNSMQINKGNNEPYILLQEELTSDKVPVQTSLFYPFKNVHVKLRDKISEIIPFNKVYGKYIGGFALKQGIFGQSEFTYFWTEDEGKTWNYNQLHEYFLITGPVIRNEKVWMEAIVGNKTNKNRHSVLLIGDYGDAFKNK